MNRALTRLFALYAVWAGVELLERVAYRAGVQDTSAAAADAIYAAIVDEDLADDLEPADVSDVVAAHSDCCGPLWCPDEDSA